jgi:xylose isomerase
MPRYPYAARLNSFATRPELFWPGRNDKPTTLELIDRAATVPGLTALDLNYPPHLEQVPVPELKGRIADRDLVLNGLAMRYGGEPAFRAGAFTNPDAAVRRRAIDLTRRGADLTREAGGRMLTLWLGQDGVDHPFQADYGRLWDLEVEGIARVAEHDPGCLISIEYKPNEPRAISVLAGLSGTLLAVAEVGAANLGMTLDFAHVLQSDESPAMAAALVARKSRLLGLHLNDAYGKRDDGLMVGSVHTIQTIELLRQLRRDSYDGAIYFDTFPDVSGLDPVAETEANIATVEGMLDLIDRLPEAELAAALDRQDAVATQRILQAALLGAPRG